MLLAFMIVFMIGAGLTFFGSGWGHSLVVANNANSISSQKLSAKQASSNKKQKTSYDASKTKSISADELWKSKKYPAYPIGRMSVPAVNIHNPLFEGFGAYNQNLSYGVVTVVQGRTMGGMNNYVLAGHYMGQYGSAVLDNLHYISKGDVIAVTDMKNIYLYKATWKSYSVKPTQVEVENNAQGKRTITLITCSDFDTSKYGFGQNRTVVQGEFVKKVKATKKNLKACELIDTNTKSNKTVAVSKKGLTTTKKKVTQNWWEKITLWQVITVFLLCWFIAFCFMTAKIWK